MFFANCHRCMFPAYNWQRFLIHNELIFLSWAISYQNWWYYRMMESKLLVISFEKTYSDYGRSWTKWVQYFFMFHTGCNRQKYMFLFFVDIKSCYFLKTVNRCMFSAIYWQRFLFIGTGFLSWSISGQNYCWNIAGNWLNLLC